MCKAKQSGLTLIELMFGLAILMIVSTVVVPTFGSMYERQKIRGAAETLVGDIQLARMEAIKTNQAVSLSFQGSGSTNWCYGINDSNGCNCNVSSSCTVNAAMVRTTGAEEFSNISLSTNFTGQTTTFNPVRGTTNSGVATLTQGGKTIQVRLSAIGRIVLCSNDYQFYPNCS